jgi:site-specific recombinase XerD
VATEAQAKAYISGVVADPATPLTRAQITDAQAALRLLPVGASLTDAARALAGQTARIQATPLKDAVEAYLAEVTGILRPRTLGSYEHTLNALVAVLPGRALGSVGVADLHAFVSGRTAATRNTLLRRLRAFWSWAVRRGLAAVNVPATAAWGRPDEAPIHALTVDQAALLLRTAVKERPELVRYLAVGLFAGLRPAEMARLPIDAIGDDHITIDGRVAKKRSRRTIRIRPNLRAWLDAFPGPVCPLSERRRYAALREITTAAGVAWSPDVLRHTYGTMAYSEHPDVPAITAEMGNGPDVFFSAYRALAKPGDGAKFFRLCPTSVRRKS